jgi:hypothetical protein
LFLKFDSSVASQCIKKAYHMRVRNMLEMLGY